MHAQARLDTADRPIDRYRRPQHRNSLKKVKVAHTRLPSDGVPEPIPVLGSQPAGDVSHKPGGRLPLLSASYRRNP